jgi:hypothetical protein
MGNSTYDMSPKYKVFSPDDEYLGWCKYPEDAAQLVAVRGSGGTVRLTHIKQTIVWTEGDNDLFAANNFKRAAGIIRDREIVIRAAQKKGRRLNGQLDVYQPKRKRIQ